MNLKEKALMNLTNKLFRKAKCFTSSKRKFVNSNRSAITNISEEK